MTNRTALSGLADGMGVAWAHTLSPNLFENMS